MGTIRIAEVLSALSLTTDLAAGVPFEKGLRTCAVAGAFAEILDLDAPDRRAVFEAALLRSIGCTSFAPENAALFVDDIAFQAALKVLDPGDERVFAAQLRDFGTWAGTGRAMAPVHARARPVVARGGRERLRRRRLPGSRARQVAAPRERLTALDQIERLTPLDLVEGPGTCDVADGEPGPQCPIPARAGPVSR